VASANLVASSIVIQWLTSDLQCKREFRLPKPGGNSSIYCWRHVRSVRDNGRNQETQLRRRARKTTALECFYLAVIDKAACIPENL
jgi:hypothetical protein